MKNKLIWLETALLIAPFVALTMLWNRIPQRVPIHWNIRGEIDGWASKPTGLLITPMIGVLVVAFLHIIAWLDPKLGPSLQKSDRMHAVLQILGVVFAGLFAAIVAIQIAAALDHTLSTGRIIRASILILFATLGNYLPNLRPNYFIGIRTPWTLESPETWRATHRLAGRLMFFGAVSLLILQFFISEGASGTLFVGFLVLVAVWALLYSWFHYRTFATRHKTL